MLRNTEIADEDRDGRSPGALWRADAPLVPGVDLVQIIGHSARSVVYRGVRDGAAYAVKALRHAGEDREGAEFRREAALLATLRHDSLVAVHEVGDASGRPYLIMDLIEGRSLAEILDSDGALAEAQVIDQSGQVAAALAVAHRAGLVHRDIKPPNIMIQRDGRAVLVDFGLAARAGGEMSDAAVGTFLYSAPEQTGMLRRAVDGRADLYSLGVVMFECLTGARPFQDDDSGRLIQLHMTVTPPDLRTVRPGISAGLAAVVATLLAKDPDDRYQSGEALRADLIRLRTGAEPLYGRDADGVRAPEGDVLVGRSQQSDQLLARWREAAAGRGGIVLLQGPAGVGKSRLARELAAAARSTGHLVMFGKCTPDSAAPLAALREALRAAPEAHNRLAELATDDTGRDFADAVATLLVGLVGLAGSAAMLYLDDVQWCDEATRQVLRRLAPLIRGSRLLLVTTARDDAASSSTVTSFVADVAEALDLRIAVEPLDPAAIAMLVANQLGSSSVPAALVDPIAARSGGSPLTVLEYVRAVVDAGLVRPSWGSWVLDEEGLVSLALPDDVMDLVLRRVSALGADARHLLTVAAAVGSHFSAGVVAVVCDREPVPVSEAFVAASTHHLLESGAGGYTFVHDRIREALLNDLDESQLRHLHQTIAERLEAAGGDDPGRVYEVARHYLQGEAIRTPLPAYRAAEAAGTLALSEHAPVDAIEFLTQGHRLSTDAGIPVSPAFHTVLGTAACRAGRFSLAYEHLTAALRGETEPARRAELLEVLAAAYLLRWEGDRAIETVRLALAELGRPLPRNPVLLVATTAARFVVGVLVGLLPKRVRVATGARRERLRLLAHLSQMGGYCAAIALRKPTLAIFFLRSVYLANRLEYGPEAGLIRRGLCIVAAELHLRRIANRMINRAHEAAAASGQPRLISHMHWIHSGMVDAVPGVGPDTGVHLQRTLEQHGRHLDVGDYLVAVPSLSTSTEAW